MYTNIIIYSTRTRPYEQWYNDIQTFDAAAAAVCARFCSIPYIGRYAIAHNTI